MGETHSWETVKEQCGRILARVHNRCGILDQIYGSWNLPSSSRVHKINLSEVWLGREASHRHGRWCFTSEQLFVNKWEELTSRGIHSFTKTLLFSCLIHPAPPMGAFLIINLPAKNMHADGCLWLWREKIHHLLLTSNDQNLFSYMYHRLHVVS